MLSNSSRALNPFMKSVSVPAKQVKGFTSQQGKLFSSHFQPSSQLSSFFSSAKHSSLCEFKKDTTKRSAMVNFTSPTSQLSTPITTFYPTLFTPSSLSLFQHQRRDLANQVRVGNRVEYMPKDYSNLLYLIAALAAFAIGSLIVYGFTTSPEEGSSLTTQRLRQSLMYLTGGLGVTALSAKMFFNSPVYARLATMNPWASLALMFGGTMATMMATYAIPYENTLAKHAAFASFNTMIGLSLCPLVAVGGPILLKAAFATGCVVSTLGLTAAASPEGTFLSWGGPLSVGLGVVFASSVGSLFFPGSSLLYNVCLYGGAGVFGLFVLHDVDKMKVNAKFVFSSFLFSSSN